MKIGQNWLKIESCTRDRMFHQKGKEVLKMTKESQFSEKILRILPFLTKNNQNGLKSGLKLAKHS